MGARLTQDETLAVEEAAEYAEVDLRRDYSGRFMFGDTCFGIVGDAGGFAAFIAEIAQSDGALAERLSKSATTDSMGLSTIYYFRGFALEG